MSDIEEQLIILMLGRGKPSHGMRPCANISGEQSARLRSQSHRHHCISKTEFDMITQSRSSHWQRRVDNDCNIHEGVWWSAILPLMMSIIFKDWPPVKRTSYGKNLQLSTVHICESQCIRPPIELIYKPTALCSHLPVFQPLSSIISS